MANNPFGTLGGLMRGLSGFMPQDDPEVKLMNLRSRLEELQSEEDSLYAEIGRRAAAEAPGRFPEQEAELVCIRNKRAAAEAELSGAQQEQRQADRDRRREETRRTCPACGFQNPNGVNFCQECGAKLGLSVCRVCGAELPPGTRFCGTCGAKQEA